MNTWPDTFDWFVIAGIATIGVGLPLAGYVFMALDIRAYLRSLRRAMVVVKGYTTSLPDWVKKDTPPCFEVLGLRPPCTKTAILEAYRERVKTAHPDLGGSRREFARLQKHFEEAMSLAADADTAPAPDE